MAGDRVPGTDALVACWCALRDFARDLAAARRELAWSLALLAGWALITLSIARLVRPDVVWPLSGGLFLLALFGAKSIGLLAWNGLYALTGGGDA